MLAVQVRSLSFNFKDPSNPDLRARVLQGQIDPQVGTDARAGSCTRLAWHMSDAFIASKGSFCCCSCWWWLA